MVTKNKVLIVFIVIISIGVLSFGMHLYETSDQFKIENIPYNEVKVIKVYSRFLNNDSIISIDKEFINSFNISLKNSRPVDYNSVNFKCTKNLYEIELDLKNNKNIKLLLSKTCLLHDTVSNGIVTSGDYSYKNDSLLNFMIMSFKVIKH